MKVYESEDQQIEAIKRWWKENGKFTIFIIVIALAASFGWRYWQQYQQKESTQASFLYEQALQSMSQENDATFTKVADELQQNYHRTPYAVMAALLEARQDVADKKYSSALTKLNWVIKESDNVTMVAMARIRAARILNTQKQYQDAITMLAKVTSSAFAPVKYEVQGDAFAGLGDDAKAKAAYEQSLAAMSKTEAMYPIVQMKLASVNTDEGNN